MLCALRDLYKTEYNYHRALVWTAVMTTLSHLDPDFSNVFAIEAVNEPTRDATQTPGCGDCACEASLVFSVLKSVMNSPEEFRSGGTSSRIYFGHRCPLVGVQHDHHGDGQLHSSFGECRFFAGFEL